LAQEREQLFNGQIRKGQMVMIDGVAVKVVETTSSKTGKHGAAKQHLVGIDPINGKKHETIIRAGDIADILLPISGIRAEKFTIQFHETKSALPFSWSRDDLYSKYFQFVKDNEKVLRISLFGDVAEELFVAGNSKMALRVLSSLCELEMNENPQFPRIVAFKMEQFQQFETAISIFAKGIDFF